MLQFLKISRYHAFDSVVSAIQIINKQTLLTRASVTKKKKKERRYNIYIIIKNFDAVEITVVRAEIKKLQFYVANFGKHLPWYIKTVVVLQIHVMVSIRIV